LTVAGLISLKLLDGLADDLHEVLLEGLLLEDKTVLVPYEVRHLRVPPVALHAALEQTQDVLVVGVLGELELATVVHEFAELLGMSLAELVDSNLELLLLDVVILLVLRAPRETLPGETPAQEVEEHVTDGLEVVAARLLVADVGVDRGIASCPGQVLALSERNMLAVRVLIALGETKVDDVNVVLVRVRSADEEVVRLDVSMNDAFLVNLLDALDLGLETAASLPSGWRCTAQS
jgi:hypothetical protein